MKGVGLVVIKLAAILALPIGGLIGALGLLAGRAILKRV
jgi:hypothetical protein